MALGLMLDKKLRNKTNFAMWFSFLVSEVLDIDRVETCLT